MRGMQWNIFRQITHARYLYKSSKFVKKKLTCAVWGARYLYIKSNVEKVWGARYLPENTVICMLLHKTA
jgi:hypothetical protein